jgi:serine/threonine protein kinase
MHRVIEAIVDDTGAVRLTEPIAPVTSRRALVILLPETPAETERGSATYDARPAGQRYRIERALGEGGMGETFLATDVQSGKPVCVKRLRRGIPSAILTQEWRTLTRVISSYVVRYLDCYDIDGRTHVVMEYVEGETLARWLRQRRQSRECAWLGLSLLRGMRDFHEHAVIHCDLKPQNVIIQDGAHSAYGFSWAPKIIDFGLAILDERDADGRATAFGRNAGTPGYMAPEQIRGEMLSPACDIFAVGVILMEALSGARVAARGSEALAVKDATPAGPRDAALDAGIVRLIAACTATEPSKRPSAADAVRYLERLLVADAHISADAGPPPSRLRRLVQGRNRVPSRTPRLELENDRQSRGAPGAARILGFGVLALVAATLVWSFVARYLMTVASR